MKIFLKPIMTSALLSDDQKMPTLDSFWYMTSQIIVCLSDFQEGTVDEVLLFAAGILHLSFGTYYEVCSDNNGVASVTTICKYRHA